MSQPETTTVTRDELERRLAELSQQVRDYPRPIAHCDEQLSALLEERARVLEALKNAH